MLIYMKYLIYCFAGAISSPHRGTQCTNLKRFLIIGRVEGRSGSVIQNCKCDQEGRRLRKLEFKRWVLRCFLKDATEGKLYKSALKDVTEGKLYKSALCQFGPQQIVPLKKVGPGRIGPLKNTGPPLWERLGTCLMSYDLCLMNWMVCLRIR